MLRFIGSIVAIVVLAGSTGVYAFTDGLQVSMQFEEGSGATTADSSGNGRSATLTGAFFAPTEGHTGGGMVFDGVDDYLEFSDTSMWGLTDAISVCAWVKLSRGGAILQRGDYVRPYALSVTTDRTINWAIFTTSDNRYSSTATIVWNQWHHIVATYNAVAGTSKIYLDGELVTTGTFTGVLDRRTATTKMGTRANSYWMGGTLDDVRLYSRAISAAEVKDIFDGTETAADGTAPTVPQNLSATTVSPRQILLDWDASSDNVKVTGYKIYKDGTYLATTHKDSSEYLVYWLSPLTQYSFTVVAIDVATNASSASGAASATTLQEEYSDYYVGGWNINNEMTKITPACMATLRAKKVVGITKSFGGSMTSGFMRLKNESSPYYLDAQNVENPGASDFDGYTIVKGDTTRYPYTFRVVSLGDYLKNWAGDVVDVAFVYFHNMTASIYDASIDYPFILKRYIEVFDSLQAAYPQVQFIYTAAGIVGDQELSRPANIISMRFNELLRNQKQGLVPIYDMASLLAVNEEGDTSMYRQPYSAYTSSLQNEIDASWVDAHDRVVKDDTTQAWQIKDSGLHPNALGEKRMAKGMTLILAKMFCPDCFPQMPTGTTVYTKPEAAFASPLPYRIEHTATTLTVRWTPGVRMSLALFHITGVPVERTGLMQGGEVSFDMSNQVVGLYLLQLKQDDRTFTVKVAIVK